MRDVLGSGYIYANVVSDGFEQDGKKIEYYRLEILVDDDEKIFETIKLPSNSCYAQILRMFRMQAKANKQ